MSKNSKLSSRKNKGSGGRQKKQARKADRKGVQTAEIPASLHKSAAHSPLYRPVKLQVTVRLDADVLAWLRKGGRGYQTRANALLRELMLREMRIKSGR